MSSDKHPLAGFLAGAVPTVLLHPLDLLKVRYQALDAPQTLRARSLWRAVASLFVSPESRITLRGAYRGLAPSLLGNTASWGLYLYLYDRCKSLLSSPSTNNSTSTSTTNNNNKKQNTFSASFAAGLLAGAATTVATNPLWLIKTRIQLGQQTTIRGAVRDIVSRQGVRGLYRGLGPGLLLVSHGAVQFMVYDELNRVLGCDDPHERMLTAVASKVAAMGVTFPLQVVKTRLQDARSLGRAEYATLWGAVRAMFRGEGGVAVFYRGWVPAVVRLVPANALTLVSYEWFVRVLQ